MAVSNPFEENFDQASDNPMTIDEYLSWLAPRVWNESIDYKTWKPWPADVFAIATSLLRRVGGYLSVVQKWPPSISTQQHSLDSWFSHIESLSSLWRSACCTSHSIELPHEILIAWKTLKDNSDKPASVIKTNQELRDALVLLAVVSDETFNNFLSRSFQLEGNTDVDFIQKACFLLTNHTLCSKIDPSRVRILPKVRAPQSGLTTRSLSHNLALCQGIEVEAQWLNVQSDSFGGTDSSKVNILIVPYPYSIDPSQFAARSVDDMQMPPEFKYFSFSPSAKNEEDLSLWVWELIAISERKLQTNGTGIAIDLVIFPEAALSRSQYNSICKMLSTNGSRAAVIAGIVEPPTGETPWAKNYAAFNYHRSLPSGNGEMLVSRPTATQSKHHRWALDEQQISNYHDLNKSLPTSSNGIKKYWEGISLDKRDVHFLNFQNKFTICVLVCEDLTRVDPVGELVRSVAPDLIIALLQDGPQIESRWPGKYGTVLADDPGSSVLTVSSAGMIRLSAEAFARRSSPVLTNEAKKNAKHSVALWKDCLASKGHELTLISQGESFWADDQTECPLFPNQAILARLNLNAEKLHTADGRHTMRKSVKLDQDQINLISSSEVTLQKVV